MNRSLNLIRLGWAAFAAMALIATGGATRTLRAQEDPEAIRQRFLIAMPKPAAYPGGFADLFRGAPGTNTGTPIAFGPGMGSFFAGGGYQNTTRAVKLADGSYGPAGNDDGSVSFGFGLGDANGGVGLTTVVTSLSTFRSGFGNRTAFSFQLVRNLDPSMAVAFGVENAFIAGGGKTDGQDSWYSVVSKVFQHVSPSVEWIKAITISGGIGNGRFRAMNDVRKNNETVNVFGSIAFLVYEQISLITDYTGQDVNVGFSIVPFKKFPISITPALADVTHTANNKTRFILGAGIGVQF